MAQTRASKVPGAQESGDRSLVVEQRSGVLLLSARPRGSDLPGSPRFAPTILAQQVAPKRVGGINFYDALPRRRFHTWGNSGARHSKVLGISSPGRTEGQLIGLRSEGEYGWNAMSGWMSR